MSDFAEAAGDLALTCVADVQVDQSGATAAMTHPVHQHAQGCSCARGQRVSGVSRIVKMNAVRSVAASAGSQYRRRKLLWRSGAPAGLVTTSASAPDAVKVAR